MSDDRQTALLFQDLQQTKSGLRRESAHSLLQRRCRWRWRWRGAGAGAGAGVMLALALALALAVGG
jgi:hypothetical protein